MIKIKTRLKYKICTAITYIVYIVCIVLPFNVSDITLPDRNATIVLFVFGFLLFLISDIISLIIKKPNGTKAPLLFLTIFVTFVSLVISKFGSISMLYYGCALVWYIFAAVVNANDSERIEAENRDRATLVRNMDETPRQTGDIEIRYDNGSSVSYRRNQAEEEFIQEATERLGNGIYRKYINEFTLDDLTAMKNGDFLQVDFSEDSRFMFVKLEEPSQYRDFCEITTGSIYNMSYILNELLDSHKDKCLKIEVFHIEDKLLEIVKHDDCKTYKFSKPFNLEGKIKEPEEENIFDELT